MVVEKALFQADSVASKVLLLVSDTPVQSKLMTLCNAGEIMVPAEALFLLI